MRIYLHFTVLTSSCRFAVNSCFRARGVVVILLSTLRSFNMRELGLFNSLPCRKLFKKLLMDYLE